MALIALEDTNVTRTRNQAAPYRRKHKVESPDYSRALLTCDMSFDEPVIVSSWARPDYSVRGIEQAGKGYEQLKLKYAKLEERMRNGASAHFESEESEEEKTDDFKKGGKWQDYDEEDDESM